LERILIGAYFAHYSALRNQPYELPLSSAPESYDTRSVAGSGRRVVAGSVSSTLDNQAGDARVFAQLYQGGGHGRRPGKRPVNPE